MFVLTSFGVWKLLQTCWSVSDDLLARLYRGGHVFATRAYDVRGLTHRTMDALWLQLGSGFMSDPLLGSELVANFSRLKSFKTLLPASTVGKRVPGASKYPDQWQITP